MKVIKKAYSIDFSKIKGGYLYSDVVCYADNRNKARTILLNEVIYEDLKLIHNDEDVNYLNIPVRREKTTDIVVFDGYEVKRYEVERMKIMIEKELEYKNILMDNNITYCYIRKNGYYYRSNYSGYTEYKYNAGIYDKYDAYKHVGRSDEIRMIPIDIKEHNNIISERIEELKNHLIN